MIRKFGLIGYPLSHSFSPGYFATKFKEQKITDAQYDLYPIDDIGKFDALKDIGLAGLNVTIPYKEVVIPFIDELTPAASAIGAVNVIDLRGEKIVGHNSDVYGFQKAVETLWRDRAQPAKALVLGTGGAAKAVWYALEEFGIDYLKVSRSTGDIQYQDLDTDIMLEHELIINTTPLGMSPLKDACPDILYEALTPFHMLFDLVYNPMKTLFLQKGEMQGARIKNGLEMLELQADRSWEIWNC